MILLRTSKAIHNAITARFVRPNKTRFRALAKKIVPGITPEDFQRASALHEGRSTRAAPRGRLKVTVPFKYADVHTLNIDGGFFSGIFKGAQAAAASALKRTPLIRAVSPSARKYESALLETLLRDRAELDAKIASVREQDIAGEMLKI